MHDLCNAVSKWILEEKALINGIQTRIKRTKKSERKEYGKNEYG